MDNDGLIRVLVVDDERPICEILARWLTIEGYICETAHDGMSALERMENSEFHLVVTDIMMPGMSGVELLEKIKQSFPRTAVVMVTGVDDRKVATQSLKTGAYGYLIKPFDRNDVLINVENALERRRLTILSQEYERELEQRVQERTRQVRDREEEIVFRLISAMGYRDDETGAHTRRVGLYSEAISRRIGWNEEKVNEMRLAAPMHDVGKIAIADGILRKPGKLTPEEYEVMKGHTEIGFQILADSSVPMIKMAADIALYHHEKWDGSGYPRNLTAEDIPLAGRIVAIADVYDALVNDRVYRPAFEENEAISIMVADKGKHFDPQLLDTFLELLPEIQRIRLSIKD